MCHCPTENTVVLGLNQHQLAYIMRKIFNVIFAHGRPRKGEEGMEDEKE